MATTGEVSAEGSALAFPFPFLNKDVLVADALFQRGVNKLDLCQICVTLYALLEAKND